MAAPHGKQPDPSLARSRLNRSGLKAGAVAPEFRLPRIDGGELALTDLRGRHVLLVFSDPECGPCEELAPRLQELHQRRPDLQVVVVSRRGRRREPREGRRARAELSHRAADSNGRSLSSTACSPRPSAI